MKENRHSLSVSVVIPVFNAESYIERALDSILQQTSPADEIIVVDDGSTDQTAVKIKKYEPYITYLYQKNSGANEARNLGIQRAFADWVAFLDADDCWMPDKLGCHRALHQQYPDLIWSFSDYRVIKYGRNYKQSSHTDRPILKYLKENAYFENYMQVYAAGISVSMITLFIKKTILIQTGLFRVGQQTNHDPDLALRICYRYPKVGYVPRPLATNYFALPGSITRKCAGLVQERIDFLKRHTILSNEHKMGEEWKLCARRLLIKWLRDMQADELRSEAFMLLEPFKSILPRRFLLEITCLLKWPWAQRIWEIHHHTKRRIRKLIDRYFKSGKSTTSYV